MQQELLNIIGFSLEARYFPYEQKLHQHFDGTRMNYLASPILADIVINYVINQVE